jgi:hypothetical protein
MMRDTMSTLLFDSITIVDTGTNGLCLLLQSELRMHIRGLNLNGYKGSITVSQRPSQQDRTGDEMYIDVHSPQQ